MEVSLELVLTGGRRQYNPGRAGAKASRQAWGGHCGQRAARSQRSHSADAQEDERLLREVGAIRERGARV